MLKQVKIILKILYLIYLAGCQTSAVLPSSLDDSPAYFTKSLLLSVKVPGGGVESENYNNKLPPQAIRDRIDTFRFYFDRILSLAEARLLSSKLRIIVDELRTLPFDSFAKVDLLINALNKEVQSELTIQLNDQEKRLQIYKLWRSWTPKLVLGNCRLQNSFTQLKQKDIETHYILTRQGWEDCMGWTSLHFRNYSEIPDEIFHGITLEQAQLIKELINDNLESEERKIDFPVKDIKVTNDFTKSIGYYKYTVQQPSLRNIQLYRPRNTTSTPLPSHVAFQRIVLIFTDQK